MYCRIPLNSPCSSLRTISAVSYIYIYIPPESVSKREKLRDGQLDRSSSSHHPLLHRPEGRHSCCKDRQRFCHRGEGTGGNGRVAPCISQGGRCGCCSHCCKRNALAMDVLLGGSDGSLAFVPSDFSVASGETIVFKNNAGFPHNVVFDEDEIPPGVDASAISMKEEDLLNGPGETYTVTLKVKGTYTFYCSPHQGAGMVGKVTVN